MFKKLKTKMLMSLVLSAAMAVIAVSPAMGEETTPDTIGGGGTSLLKIQV